MKKYLLDLSEPWLVFTGMTLFFLPIYSILLTIETTFVFVLPHFEKEHFLSIMTVGSIISLIAGIPLTNYLRKKNDFYKRTTDFFTGTNQ